MRHICPLAYISPEIFHNARRNSPSTALIIYILEKTENIKAGRSLFPHNHLGLSTNCKFSVGWKGSKPLFFQETQILLQTFHWDLDWQRNLCHSAVYNVSNMQRSLLRDLRGHLSWELRSAVFNENLIKVTYQNTEWFSSCNWGT